MSLFRFTQQHQAAGWTGANATDSSKILQPDTLGTYHISLADLATDTDDFDMSMFYKYDAFSDLINGSRPGPKSDLDTSGNFNYLTSI